MSSYDQQKVQHLDAEYLLNYMPPQIDTPPRECRHSDPATGRGTVALASWRSSGVAANIIWIVGSFLKVDIGSPVGTIVCALTKRPL